MPQYEPISRRPIAGIFRRTANAATRVCIALGVSPDLISYSSIVAAAGAALCFWKSTAHPCLLLIAPLLCFVRLWFNMLDGMVAVAAGSANPWGEVVNDLPDRISDVIIFAGVAHSGWLRYPYLGYWTAIFCLITAYVGLFGQAVGGQRQFGGVMSKPWRMVALGCGTWITWAMSSSSTESISQFSVFDSTCLVIIGGCCQTIFVRLKALLRTLRNRSQ